MNTIYQFIISWQASVSWFIYVLSLSSLHSYEAGMEPNISLSIESQRGDSLSKRLAQRVMTDEVLSLNFNQVCLTPCNIDWMPSVLCYKYMWTPTFDGLTAVSQNEVRLYHWGRKFCSLNFLVKKRINWSD